MAGWARAHHALEFIEIESYTTARKGEMLVYLHYDYFSEDKDDPALDRWEVTPGASYGITDRLMLDGHVHYAKFKRGHIAEARQEEFENDGPSPFFEASAFTLQYRFTDGTPIEAAVAATVEIPFDRARDLLESAEVYEVTLILSRPFGRHGNVTLNISTGWEDSEDYQEWGIGAREALSQSPHGIAAGLEIFGEFEDLEDSVRFLPGVYIPLNEQTVLKTGFEIGASSTYTHFHISLTHRF